MHIKQQALILHARIIGVDWTVPTYRWPAAHLEHLDRMIEANIKFQFAGNSSEPDWIQDPDPRSTREWSNLLQRLTPNQ